LDKRGLQEWGDPTRGERDRNMTREKRQDSEFSDEALPGGNDQAGGAGSDVAEP